MNAGKYWRTTIGLALAACAAEPPSSPAVPPVCEVGTVLVISATAPPVFSWSPACAVHSVYVSSNGFRRWFISHPVPIIVSPVTYGVLPTNATELEGAIPLIPGVGYDVSLVVWDSLGIKGVARVSFVAP